MKSRKTHFFLDPIEDRDRTWKFEDFFKIRTLCWEAIAWKLEKNDLKFISEKIFSAAFVLKNLCEKNENDREIAEPFLILKSNVFILN